MAIAPGQRNGNITNYTLTCEPTIPSVLPFTVTDLSTTVEGFTPYTNYTCQVLGRNTAGEGPPASNTIQTPEDGKNVCTHQIGGCACKRYIPKYFIFSLIL